MRKRHEIEKEGFKGNESGMIQGGELVSGSGPSWILAYFHRKMLQRVVLPTEPLCGKMGKCSTEFSLFSLVELPNERPGPKSRVCACVPWVEPILGFSSNLLDPSLESHSLQTKSRIASCI